MKIFENLDINNLENEVWKVITNFPDYSVSNLGRIKRINPDKCNHKLKILKQNKNNKGYFQVNLYKNGILKLKYIHHLVYENFKGKLEEGCDAHHINENKEDNFIDNLESKLHSKHIKDHNIGKHHSKETIKKLSEKKKGKNNPNFKITNQKIIDIQTDIIKGDLTQREIAKKHNVVHSTVSNIKLGKILRSVENNNK